MLNIKYTFFNPTNPNKIYEICTGQYSTWGTVIKFGEEHAKNLMELFDLNEIAWDYQTFELVLKNDN